MSRDIPSSRRLGPSREPALPCVRAGCVSVRVELSERRAEPRTATAVARTPARCEHTGDSLSHTSRALVTAKSFGVTSLWRETGVGAFFFLSSSLFFYFFPLFSLFFRRTRAGHTSCGDGRSTIRSVLALPYWYLNFFYL